MINYPVEIENNNSNIESEKWCSYSIPNEFNATMDMIGWTIVSNVNGIIGVIIAVDEENIIFFAQDDFDTKYSILEIKDKMKKIVINSISYLNK